MTQRNLASVPADSEALVQNATDGSVIIYLGEQLRSGLNHTVQQNCTDLYSATCHAALQQYFRTNQTDAQHNARDLALSPPSRDKRQADVPKGADTLFALGTGGLLAFWLVLFPESAPIIFGAVFTAYVCSYLLSSLFVSVPKEIPRDIEFSKNSIDHLKKASNATAIEIVNRNQKPLIVEAVGAANTIAEVLVICTFFYALSG